VLGFDSVVLGTTGVLFLALGIYVLIKNHRQRSSLYFAIAAFSLTAITELEVIIENVYQVDVINLAIRLHALASMMCFGTMLALSLELDTSMDVTRRMNGRRAIMIGVSIAGVIIALMMDGRPSSWAGFSTTGGLSVMVLISSISILAGASIKSYFQARAASTDETFRSHCIILSMGLLLTLAGVESIYMGLGLGGMITISAICFLATEGVLIHLVVVHKLFQLPDMEGRGMQVDDNVIDPALTGSTLLVESKDSRPAYEMFIQELAKGKEGMIVTRTHPDQVRETYDIAGTRTLWLCSQPGVDRVDPLGLSILQNILLEHMRDKKNGVILLEGVEYLVSENSIDKVLRLIYTLRDAAVISGAKLIMPLDTSTLSIKDQALIEREFTVKIGHSVSD